MGAIRKLFGLVFIVILIGVAGYAGFIYGQLVFQKDAIEVEVPIRQNISLPLTQEITVPLNTFFALPINKIIYIKKTLPISFSAKVDTLAKVPMNISGSVVYVDVPIKTSIPINTSIEINEPIVFNETIDFPLNQNITVALDMDVLIPVDTVVRTKVPLPWKE